MHTLIMAVTGGVHVGCVFSVQIGTKGHDSLFILVYCGGNLNITLCVLQQVILLCTAA